MILIHKFKQLRLTLVFLYLLVSLVQWQALALSSNTIVVSSWNIQNGEDFSQIIDEIKATKLKNSDLFVIQEIQTNQSINQAQVLAKMFGYFFVFKGRDAILSKFPIQKSGAIVINKSPKREAVWADVDVGGENYIRIYGLHLSYKVDISPFIQEIRGDEISVVIEHSKSFDGPVIVAGDLNTIGDMFWGEESEPAIVFLKDAGFNDAFEGEDFSTHLIFGRLDWIFSKGFDVEKSVVGNFSVSDHRWIQTNLVTTQSYQAVRPSWSDLLFSFPNFFPEVERAAKK